MERLKLYKTLYIYLRMDFVIGRSSHNMVRINHNALHPRNLIQILNFTL